MRLRPGRLFGDILKTYVRSELRLTETLCPPGFRAPRHSHELFLFCFIIEGGFSETCGQRERECTPFNPHHASAGRDARESILLHRGTLFRRRNWAAMALKNSRILFDVR